MLKVIRENAGIVSLVARALGVEPRTIHRWRKSAKKIDLMFERVREETVDQAESRLLQNIKAGKTAEIIFYLKCMGKKRGYVERQEITGADGRPLIEEARDGAEKVRRGLEHPEVRRLLQRADAILHGVERPGEDRDGPDVAGGAGVVRH